MIEIEEEKTKAIRALLVGGYSNIQNTSEIFPLTELKGLIHTLGMEIAGEIILNKIEPTAQYGLGTGKASEIASEAKKRDADCIIFDWEIAPTHQRNWEKLASIPVFDRQEVILRIFASRAQTKEASLQVELARLSYSLPRLAHIYGDMARQRGGSYGAKGSGETQLELDKRTVQDKILKIKKELKKVASERETLRKRREKVPIPSCALVGYTNAGKSSLLNALTGSDVFVENKLFATLDPTTRKLHISGGSDILVTDTVGFISNLPHNLIDAFKSTLEEAARADLLLIVLDSVDSAIEMQYQTVLSVLDEIGASKNPRLILLNKSDCQCDQITAARIAELFPDAIHTSAKTQEGFELLQERIASTLLGSELLYKLPLEYGDLIAEVRKTGTIAKEDWKDDCVFLTARVTGKTAELLDAYKAPLKTEAL